VLHSGRFVGVVSRFDVLRTVADDLPDGTGAPVLARVRRLPEGSAAVRPSGRRFIR
jgi:CBS domain-containing protein